MTLMITTASSSTPGAPSGATEATGSDGQAGNAFAGVLAGIPESDSQSPGHAAAPDRSSAADRAGKQATESDAELAAMAGMALLVPAGSAAAALALQATLGSGTTAQPGSGDAGESSPAVPAIAPEVAAASTSESSSRPAEHPTAAVSELPEPKVESVSGVCVSAGTALGAQGSTVEPGRSEQRNSDEAAAGQQAGAGLGAGQLKAAGPVSVPDAAQTAAVARLLRSAGAAAPSADTGTSNPRGQAEPTPLVIDAGQLTGSGSLPGGANLAGAANPSASGSLPGSANPPGSSVGAPVVSRRSAKLTDGAAGRRVVEPASTTGQLPAAVPTGGPVVTAAQPVTAAAQQVPAQPALVGQQQVAGTGGHHGDRASFQPSSMAETPLARQVTAPLLALRAGGDGSHQLIVALHPAELGPVNVHVRIAGDLMTIQLASNSEIAHDALRDALPQLRSELQSSGLGGVALSLDLASGGAPGSGAFPDPRQAGGNPDRSTRAAPVPELTPVLPHQRTSGDRIGTSSSAGLDRWL